MAALLHRQGSTDATRHEVCQSLDQVALLQGQVHISTDTENHNTYPGRLDPGLSDSRLNFWKKDGTDPGRCFDDPTFLDEHGRNCSYWQGKKPCQGCQVAVELLDMKYSELGKEKLLANCPVACAVHRCTAALSKGVHAGEMAYWDGVFRKHQIALVAGYLFIATFLCATQGWTTESHNPHSLGLSFLKIVAVGMGSFLVGLIVSAVCAVLAEIGMFKFSDTGLVAFPWMSGSWGSHSDRNVCSIHAQKHMVHQIPDVALFMVAILFIMCYVAVLMHPRSHPDYPQASNSEFEGQTCCGALLKRHFRWWCNDFSPTGDFLATVSMFFLCTLLCCGLKFTTSAQNPLAAPETLMIHYPAMSRSGLIWLQAVRNMLVGTWSGVALYSAKVEHYYRHYDAWLIALLVSTVMSYTYLSFLQFQIDGEQNFLATLWAMVGILFCFIGKTDRYTTSWLRKFVLCNAVIPMYFCAGMVRVRKIGLQKWIDGEFLQSVIHHHKFASFLPSANMFIANHDTVARILSTSTMCFQLVLPWLMVVPYLHSLRDKIRNAFPIMALIFHVVIFFLMGPNFVQAVCIYTLFYNPHHPLAMDETFPPYCSGSVPQWKTTPSYVKPSTEDPEAALAEASTYRWHIFRCFVASACGICWLYSAIVPSFAFFPFNDWNIYTDIST
jgi:hypothetical protein